MLMIEYSKMNVSCHQPNISVQILHTVLFTFSLILIRRYLHVLASYPSRSSMQEVYQKGLACDKCPIAQWKGI